MMPSLSIVSRRTLHTLPVLSLIIDIFRQKKAQRKLEKAANGIADRETITSVSGYQNISGQQTRVSKY